MLRWRQGVGGAGSSLLVGVEWRWFARSGPVVSLRVRNKERCRNVWLEFAIETWCCVAMCGGVGDTRKNDGCVCVDVSWGTACRGEGTWRDWAFVAVLRSACESRGKTLVATWLRAEWRESACGAFGHRHAVPLLSATARAKRRRARVPRYCHACASLCGAEAWCVAGWVGLPVPDEWPIWRMPGVRWEAQAEETPVRVAMGRTRVRWRWR